MISMTNIGEKSGDYLYENGYDAGAMSLWNHDALFDYQDRYMAVTGGEPDPFGFIDVPNAGEGWRGGGFTADMWDEYRDDY